MSIEDQEVKSEELQKIIAAQLQNGNLPRTRLMDLLVWCAENDKEVFFFESTASKLKVNFCLTRLDILMLGLSVFRFFQ